MHGSNKHSSPPPERQGGRKKDAWSHPLPARARPGRPTRRQGWLCRLQCLPDLCRNAATAAPPGEKRHTRALPSPAGVISGLPGFARKMRNGAEANRQGSRPATRRRGESQLKYSQKLVKEKGKSGKNRAATKSRSTDAYDALNRGLTSENPHAPERPPDGKNISSPNMAR